MNLDLLKLYRGEDLVRQNPNDVDPDQYAEEGELTELPEIPWRETERVDVQTGLEVPVPEIHIEQGLAMDLQETPEEIAEREDTSRVTE